MLSCLLFIYLVNKLNMKHFQRTNYILLKLAHKWFESLLIYLFVCFKSVHVTVGSLSRNNLMRGWTLDRGHGLTCLTPDWCDCVCHDDDWDQPVWKSSQQTSFRPPFVLFLSVCALNLHFLSLLLLWEGT